MLKKISRSREVLNLSASQGQRIRLLLRDGIIAVPLRGLARWLLIHVMLAERAGSPAAWITFLLAMIVFLQMFTPSDQVWRFSGRLFVYAGIVGFKLIVINHPIVCRLDSLPLTVLGGVGASTS